MKNDLYKPSLAHAIVGMGLVAAPLLVGCGPDVKPTPDMYVGKNNAVSFSGATVEVIRDLDDDLTTVDALVQRGDQHHNRCLIALAPSIDRIKYGRIAPPCYELGLKVRTMTLDEVSAYNKIALEMETASFLFNQANYEFNHPLEKR